MWFPDSKRPFLYALTLCGAFSAQPALANYDGTLDTSLNPPLGVFPYFGVPGLFDYAVDQGGASPYTNYDSANALLVQPDGKIVVVGTSWASGTTRSSHVGVIERFLADGTADTSFGTAGRVLVGTPDNEEIYLQSVALQGSSLIVAGIWTWSSNLGNDNALLFRVDMHGVVEMPYMVGGFGSTSMQIADAGFNKVVVDSAGDIYTAGYWRALSGARFDVNFFDPNGIFRYSFNRPFGTSTQDGARAYDAVLQFVPAQSCGNGCVIPAHDELYVVGTAYQGVYPSGLTNHDCAIVAFRRSVQQTDFSIDTQFNSGGTLAIDFPMAPSNEGDNYCQAAVSRLGGSGVVVGGENIFISTLGGGAPGPASNYALAEVDAVGNVTRRDALAFFQDLAYPGIYNAIYDMVREPGGKLLVTGYAGTSDANHQPSDAGVIRFNADFSRDSTFGNDGLGLATLSLDGLGSMYTGQREWGSRLALDSRGRIALIGERSYQIGGFNANDYDWLVARLNNSDVIFRDSFDGVVPPVN